jgi:diaminopimelate epimerase
MGMVRFFKLTGSGNDFIFIDGRGDGLRTPMPAERIQRLCARGTGIGADGIVFLDSDPEADVRIRYFNADGSVAALCGNATLCTTRLARELGIGDENGLRIATDSGLVRAQMTNGIPEFEVPGIDRVTADAPIAPSGGEVRIGYAVVGVPHVVVEVADIEAIDLMGRGRVLRAHPWTGAPGANVDFVAPDPRGGWAMRTYERGVEGETLACGTGAVGSATLLRAWGRADGEAVRIWTRSGAPLDVTVQRDPPAWRAALRGEGRLVFRGELDD